MEALTLQSFEKEWVIKIDKSQFSPEFIMRMLKRIRLEWLAKTADFDPSLAQKMTDEIEENWWKQYGDEFLKDVAR